MVWVQAKQGEGRGSLAAEMKEGEEGFVRADQIDLKSLDEQLERHLSRAWTMEKQKKEQLGRAAAREEWEIDPARLVIKTVIGRGTFGTVHRGIYDGVDVAGAPPKDSNFSISALISSSTLIPLVTLLS